MTVMANMMDPPDGEWATLSARSDNDPSERGRAPGAMFPQGRMGSNMGISSGDRPRDNVHECMSAGLNKRRGSAPKGKIPQSPMQRPCRMTATPAAGPGFRSWP
jgi:hypothetical protein